MTVPVASYADFLERKTQLAHQDGFEPLWLPDWLFDFQSFLTAWAIRHGRGALLEDCGLGKTPQELVWAQNVQLHTQRPVLILTPLGVVSQFIREGEKFGIECARAKQGKARASIELANYERLHQLEPSDYAGVVCDEASVLKAFDGKTRAAVTRFLRKVPYRLLATATAAPNDFVELGTLSEALGNLGYIDMLTRFFKNARNNVSQNRDHGRQVQWRFRGHAEQPFWRWVCSWARSLRKPSDLGFDDSAFALPALQEREHVVKAKRLRDGLLFSLPAVGLGEEREERRRTLAERCEMAAELVNHTGRPAVAWCQLNDEGDLLERMIPDAVQVSGKDSDEAKEEKCEAFATGGARVLVTKPVIGAWGLNWQHCAHMTSFGSHSFEQYYQSVRRFWRFGQTRPVVVDHVLSEGEQYVIDNLRRKQRQADRLFAALIEHMRDELRIENAQAFPLEEKLPSWL